MEHANSVESVVKIHSTANPSNADLIYGEGMLAVSSMNNRLFYVKKVNNQLTWQIVDLTPPATSTLTYAVSPKSSGNCDGNYIEFLTYEENKSYIATISVHPSIVVIGSGIQLHLWNQVPNSDFLGRFWQGELTGNNGQLPFKLTSTLKYLTLMARNPGMSDSWDSVFFTVLSANNSAINIQIGVGDLSPF
jgi:hypothetical protein